VEAVGVGAAMTHHAGHPPEEVAVHRVARIGVGEAGYAAHG
jgi:hypothetical protein